MPKPTGERGEREGRSAQSLHAGNPHERPTHSTGQNELCDVLRLSLKSHAAEHDNASDEDGLSASQAVGDEWRKRECNEAADVLDACQDTCKLPRVK